MNKGDLKKFVNKIFKTAGDNPIENLGADFADGIRYQRLFNLLYDEKIDCKLAPSNVASDRLRNWSKINQVICFNYLQ